MRDRLVLLIIIFIIGILLAFIHLLVPIDKLFMVILLMVFYTIILSAAFSHQNRRNKKRPLRLNYNYEPSISIMIPAHNEENVIRKTVENILLLDYDDFEVFVIDDRSTDNTPTANTSKLAEWVSFKSKGCEPIRVIDQVSKCAG